MLSLVACDFDASKVKDGGDAKTEKDKDDDGKKKDKKKKDKDKEKDPGDEVIDEPPVTVLPIVDYNLEQIELYTNTITDFGYSDDYTEEYARCRYNLIFTGETVGNEYSALTETFATKNMDKKEGAIDYINQSVQDVKDWIETSGDLAIYPFYDETYQDIMRSDERVVSLLYYNDMYMGGAHGMYGWGGENYDPVSGEKITISDVVLDIDRFNEILKEKLLEYDAYLEESTIDTNLEAYKNRLSNGEGDYNWSIDYSGITVYFNPYEMGSYAQGAQNIRIRFDEHNDLFNEYYAVRPGSYMTGGDPLQGVYTDIDSDGVEEDIYVVVSYADDLYTMNLTIGVGDEVYYVDMPGYGVQSYIAHMADDKEYLVLSSDGMSGSYSTMVLSFDGGDMTITDTSESGIKYIELGTDEYGADYAKIAPYDPYYFMLGTRIDILGTYEGRNWYYIDENGCLESYYDVYSTYMPHTLVASGKFVAYEVVDSECTYEEFTVEVGTEMEIVGSDAETFVDVAINGDIYRIFVEIDDNFEQTIDGVSIYDLFEVVYFAG